MHKAPTFRLSGLGEIVNSSITSNFDGWFTEKSMEYIA